MRIIKYSKDRKILVFSQFTQVLSLIADKLEKENIESRPVWKPMHMPPVFAKCDFIKVADKAVSEDLFTRGVCLPSDTKMTEEEQNRVIKTIIDLWK